MTEKRFTITQDFEEHYRQIRDNGKVVMGCFLEPQAEALVHLLNSLNDENEEFKKALIELKEIGDYQEKRIDELFYENEQLKQLIKKVLETTPIEHNLALELKNSVRELYD